MVSMKTIVSIGAVIIMAVAGLTATSVFLDKETGDPFLDEQYFALQRNNTVEVYGPWDLSSAHGSPYCTNMPSGLSWSVKDERQVRITADGSIGNGEYMIYVCNTVGGTTYSRAVHIIVNDSLTTSLPFSSYSGGGAYRSVNVGEYVDFSFNDNDPETDPIGSEVECSLSGMNYSQNGDVTRVYGTPTQPGLYLVRVDVWISPADVEDGYYVGVAVSQPSYTHTITYNGNGATSGSASNTVVTDANSGNSNVTLANNGFYKAGYTFGGWSVGGTTYQPGQAILVGGNATVTATAVWIENTLSASANNQSGISGQSLTNQISAVANNGATFTYAIKSVSAGTASVNSGGLVTFNAPSVSTTTSCNVVVTVTAHYPDGQTKAVDCAFSVSVDPVLSFTNSITSGSLSIKGAE